MESALDQRRGSWSAVDWWKLHCSVYCPHENILPTGKGGGLAGTGQGSIQKASPDNSHSNIDRGGVDTLFQRFALLCPVAEFPRFGPVPPSLRAGCHGRLMFPGQCLGPDFFLLECMVWFPTWEDLERKREKNMRPEVIILSKPVHWHSGIRDLSRGAWWICVCP